MLTGNVEIPRYLLPQNGKRLTMETNMKKLAIAAGLLAITLPAQANPTLEGVASGLYELEKTHAFLTWTVQHNGISGYTVNFTDFDADLLFDAETPANSQLSVSINPTAL